MTYIRQLGTNNTRITTNVHDKIKFVRFLSMLSEGAVIFRKAQKAKLKYPSKIIEKKSLNISSNLNFLYSEFIFGNFELNGHKTINVKISFTQNMNMTKLSVPRFIIILYESYPKDCV